MTKLDKLFKNFDGDSKDYKISINWGSSSGEILSNISKIQDIVGKGLIPRVVNENSLACSYIINKKMFDGLVDLVKHKGVVEFDEHLGVYTSYNTIIPQIYGEGTTRGKAIEEMVVEAKVFAQDYEKNIDLFSDVFNGIQQFLVGYILLNLDNDAKVWEILRVV